MADEPVWLRQAVAELRGPFPVDAASRARLRGALREHARGGGQRAWLLRPMTVTPLRAVIASVLLLALGSIAGARLAPSRGTGAAAGGVAAAASLRPEVVSFVFVAADARSVVLVGDFNGWRADATPLTRTGSGAWTVSVPLRPGRYTYSFVVDGTQWRSDPVAPPAPGEEFGRPSSLVVVEPRT